MPSLCSLRVLHLCPCLDGNWNIHTAPKSMPGWKAGSKRKAGVQKGHDQHPSERWRVSRAACINMHIHVRPAKCATSAGTKIDAIIPSQSWSKPATEMLMIMIDYHGVPSSSPCMASIHYMNQNQATLARRSSSVHPVALAPCGSLNKTLPPCAHQGLKFEQMQQSWCRLNCSKGLDRGGTRATRQNTGCPPVEWWHIWGTRVLQDSVGSVSKVHVQAYCKHFVGIQSSKALWSCKEAFMKLVSFMAEARR